MRKVLIIFLTILTIVSLSVRAEDVVKKLDYARQVRSMHSLKPQGQAVVDQYITLLEKRIAGDDLKVIEAYNRLYELSNHEYKATKKSTLYSEFRFDYSGIPLIICQICRDSSQITPNDADEIIRKQQMRSADSRITDVFLTHIKTHKSLTNVIDYCVQQVAQGKESFRIPLAKLRIEYQQDLVQRALREKNIEIWNPNVIEHGQFKIALSEAREAITENPNMITEYDRIFHEAFELLGTREEAASFYAFALSHAASLVQTNSILAQMLNDRLGQYKARVSDQQNLTRDKR